MLRHAHYRPDLARSDPSLFLNLIKCLGGERFSSNEEITTVTTDYFAAFHSTYYRKDFKRLKHRWNKCIELEGDYVEKSPSYYSERNTS
ncbi:hypothetical protein Trydic_g9729 [Trypoxylus dichotomus]